MLNFSVLRGAVVLGANTSFYLIYLQIGNVECVQWLVRNTSPGRERLNSKEADRQRSLLHTAAKYGQVRKQGL